MVLFEKISKCMTKGISCHLMINSFSTSSLKLGNYNYAVFYVFYILFYSATFYFSYKEKLEIINLQCFMYSSSDFYSGTFHLLSNISGRRRVAVARYRMICLVHRIQTCRYSEKDTIDVRISFTAYMTSLSWVPFCHTNSKWFVFMFEI